MATIVNRLARRAQFLKLFFLSMRYEIWIQKRKIQWADEIGSRFLRMCTLYRTIMFCNTVPKKMTREAFLVGPNFGPSSRRLMNFTQHKPGHWSKSFFHQKSPLSLQVSLWSVHWPSETHTPSRAQKKVLNFIRSKSDVNKKVQTRKRTVSPHNWCIRMRANGDQSDWKIL